MGYFSARGYSGTIPSRRPTSAAVRDRITAATDIRQRVHDVDCIQGGRARGFRALVCVVALIFLYSPV